MTSKQSSAAYIFPPLEIASMALYFGTNYLEVSIIPADLFGESYINGELYLDGPYNTFDFTLLTIDPNAFRYSIATLNYFFMAAVDMARLDFQFLAGLQTLATLGFSQCLNLIRSLRILPSFPTLRSIEFGDSTGLDKVAFNNMPALQTNELVSFSLNYCYLDEDSVAQLMDWILPSSSQSLKELIITYHRMESSPIQFGSFRNLENVELCTIISIT